MNAARIVLRTGLIGILTGSLGAVDATPPAPGGLDGEHLAMEFADGTWLFASASEPLQGTRQDSVDRAVVRAQAELARTLRARVVTDQTLTESLVQNGLQERFDSTFAAQNRVSSDIVFEGLEQRTSVDQRTNLVHAAVAIPRARLAATYLARIDSAVDRARLEADAAQAATADGRTGEVHVRWAAVLESVQGMREDSLIAGQADDAATAERMILVSELQERAVKGLSQLAGRGIATVDDAVFAIGEALARTTPPTGVLQVAPFTWRDSRIASPFGRLLAQSLANQLAANGWTIQEANGDARGAGAPSQVLLGALWNTGDQIRILATVTTVADGRRIASAEIALPATAAGDIPIVPENSAQALVDQRVFTRDEVDLSGVGMELWTNKGADSQTFVEHDELTVFIRVDRPVHLRLIYHLADGDRVLLIDDLYIDESRVNRVYQLPQTFVCSSPFGAEVLQANASTEAFAGLQIRRQDGYDIIVDDLEQVLRKTRGFKKATAGLLKAERRLVMTTLAKP